MSEINATVQEEIDLIVKAARGERFHFIVVAYDHLSLIDRVKQALREKYPQRSVVSLKVGAEPNTDFIQNILDTPAGLVFIDDFELLLKNEALALGFNQKRDLITKLAIALVCFVPLDRKLLQECPRKIPDIWSVRSLLAELKAEFFRKSSGFIKWEPRKKYLSFTKQEREQEIKSLLNRIKALGYEPDSEGLLGQLYQNLTELLYSVGRYYEGYRANEEAFKIFQKLGNLNGLAEVFTSRGECHIAQGAFDQALLYFEQSLKLRLQLGDRIGEGESLNDISTVYFMKGDYDIALKYLEQSMLIAQEVGDNSGIVNALNNISQVYKIRGDYDLALKLLNSSLESARVLKDIKSEGEILNNIGQIFFEKEEYNESFYFYEQSLNVAEQIGDLSGKAAALNNISQIHKIRGNYDAANRYLERSLNIQIKIGNDWGEGTTLNNIAMLQLSRGSHTMARFYLERSKKIAIRIGDRSGLSTTLHNLAIIFWEYEKNLREFKLHEIEAYEIALKIGNAYLIYTIGNYFGSVLCKVGEAREGLTILQKALEIGEKASYPDIDDVKNLIKKYSAINLPNSLNNNDAK